MFPCLFRVVLLILGVLKGWCETLCGALARFALIRRYRDTFPTRGKATFGGSSLLGTAPIYKHH